MSNHHLRNIFVRGKHLNLSYSLHIFPIKKGDYAYIPRIETGMHLLKRNLI